MRMYEQMLDAKDSQKVADFVNVADSNQGYTALHMACKGGHVEVAKFLVNTAKADITKQDFDGNTGLEYLSENSRSLIDW